MSIRASNHDPSNGSRASEFREEFSKLVEPVGRGKTHRFVKSTNTNDIGECD
jgi:hypothetical protein